MQASRQTTCRPAREAAEVAAAYDLAARVYGPNFYESRHRFQRLLDLDPPKSPADVVLALRGGEIVGLVRIVDRALNWFGSVLPVGGLTAVAVRPDVQGQGIGRRINEAALRRCQERGDVLSFLFARRAVDGFYSKLGYVGVGSHPELRVAVPRGVGKNGFRFTRGVLPERLPQYRRAYSTSYGPLPLSVHRLPAWWGRLADRLSLGAPPPSFINGFQGDRWLGYFVVRSDAIIEVAAPPTNREALLEAILAHARSTGRSELVAALPPLHWASAGLRRLNHTQSIRFTWDGGHMARIVEAARWADALRRSAAPKREPRQGETAFRRHPAVVPALGRLQLLDHAGAYRAFVASFGMRPDGPGRSTAGFQASTYAFPHWNPLDEI